MTSKYRTGTLVLAPLFLLLSANVSADAGKVAEMCASCHGTDGASTEPEVPIISGLPEKYTVKSLTSYKDKKRFCPETKVRSGPKEGEVTDMCRVAGELSDADIKEVAILLASKEFVPAKQEFDSDKAKRGARIHDKACEKCHAEGGKEPDEDTTIIAGQWKEYLTHTFKEFRSGERAMPKKMKPKIDPLSDDDIDALVHYYASQQ